MTDRRCCEGSGNPGSGPDCGPWCVETDYDPLTLPAAYFEGLPTGVPNNLPSQPEPVEQHRHVPFWKDPEFLRRDKECKNPGCQGTGFLRNVPGPNELPCPVCRPVAAGTQPHTPTGGTSQ